MTSTAVPRAKPDGIFGVLAAVASEVEAVAEVEATKRTEGVFESGEVRIGGHVSPTGRRPRGGFGSMCKGAGYDGEGFLIEPFGGDICLCWLPIVMFETWSRSGAMAR